MYASQQDSICVSLKLRVSFTLKELNNYKIFASFRFVIL